MREVFVLSKAYVNPHTRKDGTHVKGYFNNVAPKGVQTPKPKPQGFHPKQGEHGELVGIYRLSKPTPLSAFDKPGEVATVLPGGQMIAELGGVPFEDWRDAPTTLHGWAEVEGQIDLDEPDIEPGKGMNLGAGVIIQEDDGRVWVVHPTNAFGGYRASFPKGTVEDGLSLQASAIKEAYEESGLKVQITGHCMDVARTTSVARYYTAKRVGGCPTGAGWESQAVSLVPVNKLYSVLNKEVDHGLAQKLGAGPKPIPAKAISKPVGSPKPYSGGNSLF